MVRGEPRGPRARQDALNHSVNQQGEHCHDTKEKNKRCLTSWDAGPQGPAWEKLGPFQAGAGSSSAVSPSLDLNLQQVFLRFGNIGMDICIRSCFCTNSTPSGRLDLDQLLAIKQFLDEFIYFIRVRQFSVFW